MKLKETLTNEKLKGLFKNNFDLANFAIGIARHDVGAGREVNVDALLDEIVRNPKACEEARLKDFD